MNLSKILNIAIKKRRGGGLGSTFLQERREKGFETHTKIEKRFGIC